jgi:hypothetical protein
MRKPRQILGLAAAALMGTAVQAHASPPLLPVIDFHGVVIGCFVESASAPAPGTLCTFGSGTGQVNVNGQQFLTDTQGNNYTFTGGIFDIKSNPVDGGAAIPFPPTPTQSFGTIKYVSGNSATAVNDVYVILNFYFNTGTSDLLSPTNLLSGVCGPNTGDAFCYPPGTPTVVGSPTGIEVLSGKASKVTGTGAGGGIEFTFDPANFAFTKGGDSPSCISPTPDCTSVNATGPWSGTAKIEASVSQIASGSQQSLGGDITVLTASPEPASVALFATGLVGLIPVAYYRRRRSSN